MGFHIGEKEDSWNQLESCVAIKGLGWTMSQEKRGIERCTIA